MEIVVLDGYTLNPGDLSWDELAAFGALRVYDRTPVDAIIERAQDVPVLLTNKTPLTAAILAQLPALKYIGVLATGYNVVDVVAAKSHGIVVTNVPQYGTRSVAQMVIAHMLAYCHRVEMHSDNVKQGAWSSAPDWSYTQSPQVELAGKTLGIVGFGRIGHQVGRIAAALGMNIQAYSRTQRSITDIEHFSWVDRNELFATSDFVSLNSPLTPETKGLVNEKTLSQMKPSAYLINSARGELIVEAHLAEALNAGWIAGASLDVLSTEPPEPDNPLLSAQNVLITPHMAWSTREARQRLMDIAIANLKAVLVANPQNVI